MYAHSNSILTQPETRSDLSVRRLFNVLLDEHHPRLWRQQPEGLIQECHKFVALQFEFEIEIVNELVCGTYSSWRIRVRRLIKPCLFAVVVAGPVQTHI